MTGGEYQVLNLADSARQPAKAARGPSSPVKIAAISGAFCRSSAERGGGFLRVDRLVSRDTFRNMMTPSRDQMILSIAQFSIMCQPIRWVISSVPLKDASNPGVVIRFSRESNRDIARDLHIDAGFVKLMPPLQI
jgi:hypothetical protein